MTSPGGMADIIARAQQLQAQLPPEVAQKLDPNWRPSPTQKAAALAMLYDVLLRQLTTSPQLQPLNITHEVRPTGWSISVDIPEPELRNDIEVIP